MPFAVFYISQNDVPEEAHTRELARILTTSLAANRAASITGALVSTPTHYAQILEGPREAVNAMMARIEADSRHRDVAVIASETIPQVSVSP